MIIKTDNKKSLQKYKKGIFKKIFEFFKLFFSPQNMINKEIVENSDKILEKKCGNVEYTNESNISFQSTEKNVEQSSIFMKNIEETANRENKLLQLQHEFEAGNIKEMDLNIQEVTELRVLYLKQIEDLKNSINRYKNEIEKLKNSMRN